MVNLDFLGLVSLYFFNHLDSFLFCLVNIYGCLLAAFSDLFNPQSVDIIIDESNSGWPLGKHCT